jgi:hypothetical protein
MVLAYHDNLDSHFRIPENRQRDQYYQRPYRPVAVFDGLELLQGGSSNPNDPTTYARYLAAYGRRATVPSPVRITGTVTLDLATPPGRATLMANVEAQGPLSGPGFLKVRFVLYEDDIDYRARNGETHFNWVVRDILDESDLTITQPEERQTFLRSVGLNPQWVTPNLGIAMFVQRDPPGNKEVLGAADFHFSAPN